MMILREGGAGKNRMKRAPVCIGRPMINWLLEICEKFQRFFFGAECSDATEVGDKPRAVRVFARDDKIQKSPRCELAEPV